MSRLATQAQAALEFIPPAFNPLVLGTVKLLMPFWIRWQTAIADLQADNVEVLVNLYREFQEGKTRFLIAFRHPSLDDPYCMSQLLWQLVPQVAKQQGIVLKQPVHVHFIYDRGIPLWTGSLVGWLFAQLGGTPIYRGKADWTGLRSARSLFMDGLFPMAAAPEGGTNGHNEVLGTLEPGIAQLAFWCAEDLQKAERSEQVVIVPVGIKYCYLDAPWQAIEELLLELETASGLRVESGNLDLNSLYKRLYNLGNHLASLMEEFYTEFYHQKFPALEEFEESEPNEILATRLQNLLNTALSVAETYFGISSKGTLVDRCRRIEQAGWNYLYRDDFKDIDALSAVEKGLANRIAEEASLHLWHMRLVENFVAVTGRYVLEKPTAERFAETSLQIWKMITQICGGDCSVTPRLGQQKVRIVVGEPISVSERYPTYQVNRLSARQAVADLTQDLQTALEGLILVD